MKKKILLLVLISLLISIVIIPVNIAAESSIYFYSPYPQGVIGLSKPEIGWTIFLGYNEVESIVFLLNGNAIDVKYDEDRETFYSTPDYLLSGENEIKAILKLVNWTNIIEKTWSFTVDDLSIDSLPYPNEKQLTALNYANDYRYVLSLPLFEFNSSLNIAAQKHAEYQANSDIFSHNQIEGTDGFFGESVLERANYFGFDGNLYEDISYQSDPSTQRAVDSLFDAPYHRIPFLVPYNQYFGYGMNGYYHVLNFGNEKEPETIMVAYPGPDQKNVPIAWQDNETPDPLRFHVDSMKFVGYPIVVGIYGNDFLNLIIKTVNLWDEENNEIPYYLNSPKETGGNDEYLDQEVIIIPKKPLDLSKTYKIRVELEINDNGVKQIYDNTWYFTTEGKKDSSYDLIHSQYIYPPLQYDNQTIQFRLGQRYIWIDDEAYPLDATPFIQNNRTMVPIRALGNSLGAYVNWDSATKTVIYEKENLSIKLPINSSYVNVNGVDILLDQGAILKEGRSYVPIRFVSEQLGANVLWLPTKREVIITNNAQK